MRVMFKVGDGRDVGKERKSSRGELEAVKNAALLEIEVVALRLEIELGERLPLLLLVVWEAEKLVEEEEEGEEV